jgi:hypothetical protein
MHQRLQFARDESVVDKEVFLYSETIAAKTGVAPLEIPNPIIFHAMPQDQVLRPSRRPNRIRLHKSHPMQHPLQRGWNKKALRNREPPQMIKCDRHQEILPNPRIVDDLRPHVLSNTNNAVDAARWRREEGSAEITRVSPKLA